MNKLKIETRTLDQIRPYHRNPRKNERAVQAVAMSIEEYGFSVPIIIDGAGVIIAGHTRYAAAQRLQMTEVPVIVKDDLTPEQVQAFRIADNKVAEYSGWDKDLLKVEFEALQEADFDLLKTGFKEHEIRKLTQEAEEALTEKSFSLNDVAEFVKPGEIWQLGKHRLICGDSTDPKTYEALIPAGQKISLMVTDPPYGVDYTGRSDRLTGDAEKIDNDNMGEAALREFLFDAFKAADPYMKPGASFYIFHPDNKALPFRLALQDVKWKLSQVLIWIKQTSVMTRQHYHWIHEPILFGWKQGAAHYFTDDFTQKTVLGDDRRDIKKMSKRELQEYAGELREKMEQGLSIIRADRPFESLLHPTMKPVDLLGQLIRNSSITGATVLEPFSGSGSTILACEQLDRVCFAIEKDPHFASGSIVRWQNETGQKAVKVTKKGEKK